MILGAAGSRGKGRRPTLPRTFTSGTQPSHTSPKVPLAAPATTQINGEGRLCVRVASGSAYRGGGGLGDVGCRPGQHIDPCGGVAARRQQPDAGQRLDVTDG